MSTSKWISLRSSVEQAAYVAQTPPHTETGKKFRVVQAGYIPTKRKAQTVNRCIDGAPDVCMGGIYYEAKFLIRCPYATGGDTTDPHMGIVSDLDRYFGYNNANPTVGNPSNVLTMIDHYGMSRQCCLVGDFTPQPLSTIIEGAWAHAVIQIEFIGYAEEA